MLLLQQMIKNELSNFVPC